MRKKIVRMTTVPISLGGLLQGQSRFMNQYYEVLGVSSNADELQKVGAQEDIRTVAIDMTRKITPIKDLKALFKLYWLLRKEKPFIVHSHTPKAGTLGMFAAWLARVPHRLHTIAGLPLVEAAGAKRTLLNLVEKITYACATKVYPNSIGLQKIVLEHKFTSLDKLKVIGEGSSNGIDVGYFDPSQYSIEEKQNLRQQLKLTQEDFVFIYVGRLVGDKGLNELIAAFKNILNEHDNVQLLLVGSHEKELDPLLPETDKFIKSSDKVIGVGWRDDVRPYFAISDCLAFPSYREGFPNVVMQAGAMELYSIVSDINGCNEIIQEKINGTIVPPKSSKALYEAMKGVLAQQTELREKKNSYRKIIVERYERHYIWQELLKEYQKLEKIEV